MKQISITVASLILICITSCSRQPSIEATVTAYIPQVYWERRNAAIDMGIVSIPEKMELRHILTSKEFWVYYSSKNLTKTEHEIRKIRQGLSVPTLQISEVGNDYIEKYSIQLNHGDQSTFDSLISSYKIFQADQVERARRDTLSQKEFALQSLGAVKKSLSAMDAPPHKSDQTDPIELRARLERRLVEYQERIARSDKTLAELAKVGKIISIEPPPSSKHH